MLKEYEFQNFKEYQIQNFVVKSWKDGTLEKSKRFGFYGYSDLETIVCNELGHMDFSLLELVSMFLTKKTLEEFKKYDKSKDRTFNKEEDLLSEYEEKLLNQCYDNFLQSKMLEFKTDKKITFKRGDKNIVYKKAVNY